MITTDEENMLKKKDDREIPLCSTGIDEIGIKHEKFDDNAVDPDPSEYSKPFYRDPTEVIAEMLSNLHFLKKTPAAKRHFINIDVDQLSTEEIVRLHNEVVTESMQQYAKEGCGESYPVTTNRLVFC